MVASWAFCAVGELLERLSGRSISRPPNTSWIIGDAIPITPMPALTLRHSTPHSSQNCGVFQAWSTWTWRRGDHAGPECGVLGRDRPLARCLRATVHSAGGTR